MGTIRLNLDLKMAQKQLFLANVYVTLNLKPLCQGPGTHSGLAGRHRDPSGQIELDPQGCSPHLAGPGTQRIKPNGTYFMPVRSPENRENAKNGPKWPKITCLGPFLDQLSSKPELGAPMGTQACPRDPIEVKKSTQKQSAFECQSITSIFEVRENGRFEQYLPRNGPFKSVHHLTITSNSPCMA